MAGLYFKDPSTQVWTFLSLAGTQGPTGPTGPGGIAGLAGPTGPTGYAGPQGITGPMGARGADGALGITGPQGPQGTAGAKGPPGAQGGAGPQGIQGPGGAQGPAGPAGADHGIQFRAGMATVSPSANANTQGAWVAFSSPYGGTPAIVIGMRTSTPGDIYKNATQTGATNAGFYPCVYRTNTTNCLVDWYACKLRGTLVSAEEAKADREARAFYHDVAKHCWFVQSPILNGAHFAIEATDWDTDEESGILSLFDVNRSLVREFGPGEWTSVQHEYVIDGAF